MVVSMCFRFEAYGSVYIDFAGFGFGYIGELQVLYRIENWPMNLSVEKNGLLTVLQIGPFIVLGLDETESLACAEGK